ncbi:MAG: hypothetical protein ACYSUK_10290 [Planctomycetota bacterium]|jgi:hypothetical protein
MNTYFNVDIKTIKRNEPFDFLGWAIEQEQIDTLVEAGLSKRQAFIRARKNTIEAQRKEILSCPKLYPRLYKQLRKTMRNEADQARKKEKDRKDQKNQDLAGAAEKRKRTAEVDGEETESEAEGEGDAKRAKRTAEVDGEETESEIDE